MEVQIYTLISHLSLRGIELLVLSWQVRVEAALTLRALAEVDPTCANNLLSCGVTTLRALREIVVVEKVSLVLFLFVHLSCGS